MGKKLNLAHLSEDECEQIMYVLQKDLEVRQTEKERLGSLQTALKREQNKREVLSKETQFNRNCCIRCCKIFGLIFNRKQKCCKCGFFVCKDCRSYVPSNKDFICHVCIKEQDVKKQDCKWFYDQAGQKFRRHGTAKIVRSLYKTTSYCKLRHALWLGGLANTIPIPTSTDSDQTDLDHDLLLLPSPRSQANLPDASRRKCPTPSSDNARNIRKNRHRSNGRPSPCDGGASNRSVATSTSDNEENIAKGRRATCEGHNHGRHKATWTDDFGQSCCRRSERAEKSQTVSSNLRKGTDLSKSIRGAKNRNSLTYANSSSGNSIRGIWEEKNCQCLVGDTVKTALIQTNPAADQRRPNSSFPEPRRFSDLTAKKNLVKKKAKSCRYPDTELATSSYRRSRGKKSRPGLPDEFRDDKNHADDDDDDGDNADDDDDEDSGELPLPSPTTTPTSARSLRDSSVGRLGTRAGSVETLNLLSSSSFASSSSSPSRRPQQRSRTPDPAKPRRSLDAGVNHSNSISGSSSSNNVPKARTPDPLLSLARWDEDAEERRRAKSRRNISTDLYKHAFESARKAEEHKFKAKFDVLLTDLHRTLGVKSSTGLADTFASTSYGEVMFSFRGRVKDLLIGFSQRLQLAYESFEEPDIHGEDQGQHVKQHVSRFLEDLLGESLDLTSDEAVSDLSSLSDDSANDRHTFEDQIAQAVVSRILESHRREVHHNLHGHQRPGELNHLLSAPSLVPEGVPNHNGDDDDDDGVENNDDNNTDGGRSSCRADIAVRDTDISKDFEDLKNFVHETQSKSRQFEDSVSSGQDHPDGSSADRSSPRVSSGFESSGGTTRDSAPLPDFSSFEQIDFNSGDLDPDLLQMNLAVIPEETEEELEEEAQDNHWRENWIFKGYPPSSAYSKGRKRVGDGDQPQYMMVPRPDDELTPKVGNRDVDQLSDLSDNEDLTDDDHNAFYASTSEELARIGRHKRSSPSLASPSLIPTLSLDDEDDDSDDVGNHNDHLHRSSYKDRGTRGSLDDLFLQPKKPRTYRAPAEFSSFGREDELSSEDVGVGTEDLTMVGPIVAPTAKDLKLLEDLVPADDDDPKFLVPPDSVTIQEGEPVRFSCRVGGTQPIDVFWYREQEEVEELEEGEDVELQVEGDRHQASLYNVAKPHAGQYMCIALSDKGKAIKYLTVTVKDNKQELKKPEFLKEIANVEVMEGQSVKLRCKVKGYPQPRINWYKDGNLLRGNKSCRIEKFGNRDYILTIDYATMDDDAEYTVVARNVAGQVKSSAEVIVEPYAEGHPLLSKNRSMSVSTVYSDLDSEVERSYTPVSRLTDDGSSWVGRQGPRSRQGEDKVDALVSKVTTAKDNIRNEAEGMLATAEELSALNRHLEDMERHLDSLEGRGAHLSVGRLTGKEEKALRELREEEDMAEVARNVRKITSKSLSMLRAAEEIIDSEKNTKDYAAASCLGGRRDSDTLATSPFERGGHSDFISSYLSVSSPSEENNNASECSLLKNGALLDSGLSLTMIGSCLTSTADLSRSAGSTGYGTAASSMTSSGLEDVVDGNTGYPSKGVVDDEFILNLPPLGDDLSGSYRQEVSINLKGGASISSSSSSSRSSGSKANIDVSGAKSSPSLLSSSTLLYRRAERGPTRSNLDKPTSIASPSSVNIASDSISLPSSALSSEAQKPATSLLKMDFAPSSPADIDFALQLPSSDLGSGDLAEDLVLNFGPKEANKAAYGRDYEIRSPRDNERESGGESKRWSVSLESFSPRAEVVNRSLSLEETEEKIYLTAGRTFNLEERVIELQSRITLEGGKPSATGMGDLEDQVARSAAHVDRTEKEVAQIERAVNTLQFSPRSSRGSNSSAGSTPRAESIDSGFAPDRQHAERPLPVHMVGQTQEEELPESRAEYDADSGVELPSVSRLRAMFGGKGKPDLDFGDGGFKRAIEKEEECIETPTIHSITARSLTKEQLQKLREAGNTTLNDHIVRLKPDHHSATRASSAPQRTSVGVAARENTAAATAASQLTAASPPQTALASVTLRLQPGGASAGPAGVSPSVGAASRQVLTKPVRLEDGAQYKSLDPNKEPVLIYPEEHPATSSPAFSHGSSTPTAMQIPQVGTARPSAAASSSAAHYKARAPAVPVAQVGVIAMATPQIRSGCISARAAFWERRIMQGEATDTNVEEDFPEMVQNGVQD